MIFIKRLDKSNQYDIFLGNGWDSWTRVRRNHWGVSVVAGARLPRNVITELNKKLVK